MINARLSEIALAVADLDASRRWYEQVFDQHHPVCHWDGPRLIAVEFQYTSGVSLTLCPRPVVGPDAARRAPSIDAVRLECDAAQLERWRCRLDELGIDWGDVIGAGGRRVGLTFLDPDGMSLEIVAAVGNAR